jgi:hypothetical protein
MEGQGGPDNDEFPRIQLFPLGIVHHLLLDRDRIADRPSFSFGKGGDYLGTATVIVQGGGIGPGVG